MKVFLEKTEQISERMDRIYRSMVVKITSPHSLQRALNYNEKKVQKGQAECIHAGNYLLNPEQMKFHQKMERMQDLISLNERTKKTNTLHISLNFDPSEKHTKEKLSAIAQDYMQKIGFGNQPYLVYQHNGCRASAYSYCDNDHINQMEKGLTRIISVVINPKKQEKKLNRILI